MSPNAQYETLHIMALKVLRRTANNIAESGRYSIMADDSTDASNIEQLVICIHWWTRREYARNILVMPVTKTNADTIVVCIKDMLLCMNLRIQDAHGQSYDGCLTTIGTKNGVAAQIKKQNEKCLLTYCYCQTLHLAVG